MFHCVYFNRPSITFVSMIDWNRTSSFFNRLFGGEEGGGVHSEVENIQWGFHGEHVTWVGCVVFFCLSVYLEISNSWEAHIQCEDIIKNCLKLLYQGYYCWDRTLDLIRKAFHFHCFFKWCQYLTLGSVC